MIKTFIDKLFGKSPAVQKGAKRVSKSPFGKRDDIAVKDHGIDPQLVDERAMDVVHNPPGRASSSRSTVSDIGSK